MNCDGVSNLLSAYLDGELTPGELLRVEEHLRRCHACADEVDSLRQTVALVASLEEVEVPASFQMQLHQRLVALGPPMAAVRRLPAAPTWQRNVRRWAVPAAAAAAALAIGLTTFDPVRLTGGLKSESEYNLAAPVKKQGETPTQPDPAQGVQSPNQGGQTPSQGPLPKTPDPTPAQPPVTPPVIPPGPTDSGGGAHGAGTVLDQQPPQTVAAQMEHIYQVTVQGTLDPKTEERIRFENANAVIGNNTLSIQVPVGSKQEVLDRVTKDYFRGSTWKDTSVDIGQDLENARKRLEAAQLQLDAESKVPGRDTAAAQKLVDEAKADYDLMSYKTTFATILVTFTP